MFWHKQGLTSTLLTSPHTDSQLTRSDLHIQCTIDSYSTQDSQSVTLSFSICLYVIIKLSMENRFYWSLKNGKSCVWLLKGFYESTEPLINWKVRNLPMMSLVLKISCLKFFISYRRWFYDFIAVIFTGNFPWNVFFITGSSLLLEYS